ncbi:unnamed protein product [Calypogeia fissa]
MKSAKDRQGSHGDRQVLERLHRAKSRFMGSLSCRRGEDYISPSPRGSAPEKTKEKAKRKGEHEKLQLEDPLFIKISPRKGNSKRRDNHNSKGEAEANGKVEPKSDLLDQGDKLGTLKTNAASADSGLAKSDETTEKAQAKANTDSLQDKHSEIEGAGDRKETNSETHTAHERDSRPIDLLKTVSSNDLDAKLDAKPVNGGIDPPPVDFQPPFRPNSEIEEVGEAGEVPNTSSSDSEALREAERRKVEEEKQRRHDQSEVDNQEKVPDGIQHSESDRPQDQYTESSESSATGKAGQNIVIPYSDSTYTNLQDADGGKMKTTMEQTESPVSVLGSGALGSGRWAGYDSANNTPHPRGDQRAVSTENGEGDKIETKESINLTTEQSSPSPPEEGHRQEKTDPNLVQKMEQNVDENTADSTRPSSGIENQEGSSADHGESDGLAQSSDGLLKEEGEKMQEGLDEKQVPEGGLIDLQIAGNTPPKPEASEELPTEKADKKAAANGVHQDGHHHHHHPHHHHHHHGTHDSYKFSDDSKVAGSPKLYGLPAAEKDDRASMYAAGEDRPGHFYADYSDYTGLQDPGAPEGAAQLARQEQHPGWKGAFFSLPNVLAVGALTVLTVLGKAANS